MQAINEIKAKKQKIEAQKLEKAKKDMQKRAENMQRGRLDYESKKTPPKKKKNIFSKNTTKGPEKRARPAPGIYKEPSSSDEFY